MEVKTSQFMPVNIDPIAESIGKSDFTHSKRIELRSLVANQDSVDFEVIEKKMKGKGLTKPYVVERGGRLILIDGHHTCIAKMLNAQQYAFVNYLAI